MPSQAQHETPRLRARLDLVATVLTIATCLLVCTLLVLRVTGTTRGVGTAVAALSVGSVLKLPVGVAGTPSDLTVLVSLSSQCRFCTESMPAFRLLNEFVRSQGSGPVRILALSTESLEVLTPYLHGNGLTAFQPTIVRSDSEIVRVIARTPTLVLVNRAGRILAAQSGQMTTAQMKEFIRRHLAAGKSG